MEIIIRNHFIIYCTEIRCEKDEHRVVSYAYSNWSRNRDNVVLLVDQHSCSVMSQTLQT